LQRTNKFKIILRTKSLNGLLLYCGKENSKSYLLLGILNGKFVFMFSLPQRKKSFSLTSKAKLNDNKWHTITVERNKRKATLLVDAEQRINVTFDVYNTNDIDFGDLLTDGLIHVGGYRKLSKGFSQSFYHGFQGCITELKIDDREIDLIKNNLNNKILPTKCSDIK
jgi:cadherin EGF LAG seven-pass G-type receptor 1